VWTSTVLEQFKRDVAYAFRTLLRAPAVCFRPFPIGTLTDSDGGTARSRSLRPARLAIELKWDGFRAIAERDHAGNVNLYSRNHRDFAKRFPPIVEALSALNRPAFLTGKSLHWTSKATLDLNGW
jgi:ATP-dependent DNA ligase